MSNVNCGVDAPCVPPCNGPGVPDDECVLRESSVFPLLLFPLYVLEGLIGRDLNYRIKLLVIFIKIYILMTYSTFII